MLQDGEFDDFWKNAALDWPFEDGALVVEQDVKDLLHRLLDPNPKTRITLKETLKHKWWFAAEQELSNVCMPPTYPPLLHSCIKRILVGRGV